MRREGAGGRKERASREADPDTSPNRSPNSDLTLRLVGAPAPNMAGEDFAFFLSRKPGAFFFIGSNPDQPYGLNPGVRPEEEAVHGTKKTIAHHTPEFDIHEGALWCGAALWTALATDILR